MVWKGGGARPPNVPTENIHVYVMYLCERARASEVIVLGRKILVTPPPAMLVLKYLSMLISQLLTVAQVTFSLKKLPHGVLSYISRPQESSIDLKKLGLGLRGNEVKKNLNI